MGDIQGNLGRALLNHLADVRAKKGAVTLEDIGGICIKLASGTVPAISQADQIMHDEVRRLARYIADAKQEIFAISDDDKSGTVIVDASQHLDEVIKETEQASNTIMDAADVIQDAIKGTGGGKEKAIKDATNRIYEACNFQDITGQRISKVIKLLETIEERIASLNNLVGMSENDTDDAHNAGEKGLLAGPQLAGQAPSQAEIDMLFASLGGKK